jgi:preprotein translocase subunit SecE
MVQKFVDYLRESKEELRKVVWPSRQVVLRDTVIVVAISLTMAVFFGALDFGLNIGFEKLLEYSASRGF